MVDNMKGINPYYLYAVGSSFLLAVMFFLLTIVGELSPIHLIGIIFGLFIVYFALMQYTSSKLRKINTGRLIYRGVVKIGGWHHILLGLIFILVGFLIVYYFTKGGLASVILASFILFFGFLIVNLKQTHHISIYENGVVIDGLAFYDWREVEKKETDNKLILKIKGIPKEITLDKTANKWDYENWYNKDV